MTRPLLKAAHRVGDRVHAVQMGWARRFGFIPEVVAYRGYGTTTRVRILARVLYGAPGLHRIGANTTREPSRGRDGCRPGWSEARPQGWTGTENVRGWRAFTSVPIEHSVVTIEIGDTTQTARADFGGVVDAMVDVTLEPGWHPVRLSADGAVPAVGQVLVVDPATTFGIVSDIDDTVMVTALPRPFLALWNTFVLSERARTPTPGMSVLLDRLAARHPEAPVMYLSTGPWNAAPTLSRFLGRNLYPAGPLLLTDWGMTPDSWFRSGREHKARNLARLAAEFPDVKWLLIGDNGQHDEAIYAEFARRHPESVAAVAIRELTGSEAVFSGGTMHDGHPTPVPGVPWASEPDGAALAEQLEALGVL
ncbi:phosphatase domain-containing protein [Sinomonas sp. JGH33]|uniref:Phosphatase domain-containing protein n=1 Tax=Sinomonas terricola TaxID=3110330 RepID=A0ABU5T7M7_9MICC|nr:phosphatase domain-containing protein [Sinomonas sp. JGH33]MEA5455687.1 phosphatase domain-containing protein [Sinomonas sp. JGH33]